MSNLNSRPDSPDSGSTGSSKPSPGRPSSRRQRLQEYRRQGLAHPDPLQAVLSSVNAGLIEVTEGLGKAIRRALRGSAKPLKDADKPLEDGPDLLKAVQSYTNCARLVQRFTLFDERFRSPSPKPSDAAPPGDRAELPDMSDGEKPAAPGLGSVSSTDGEPS